MSSNTNTVRKTAYVLACLLGAAYLVAACSSDDTAQIVADESVTITGTINNLGDPAEAVSGVEIEAVYGSPGDALNPVAFSNSNAVNNFSLEVFSNTPFFLHATKDTFATINTARTALNADITVDPVEIPTVDQAQSIIDTAFSSTVQLSDYAWLVVDVVDVNDNGVIGKTISIPPTFETFGETYTNCDGTGSTGGETTGPCPEGRQAPMYIAFFDKFGEVSITVGGQKQTAPIRKGEITVLEFEVAANEFFTISGRVTGLTGNAMEGVDVEAVYTFPGDLYNPATRTNNAGDYSLQVLKDKTTYLHMTTQTGFVNVNTLKVQLMNTGLTGIDIKMLTPVEAKSMLDKAFSADFQLSGFAWLMVDIVDGSGDEIPDKLIIPTPAPVEEVYTDCAGNDGGAVTIGPCITVRQAPMYIAYFDGPDAASVSTNSENSVIQIAPLVAGEITYLVFEPDPKGP